MLQVVFGLCFTFSLPLCAGETTVFVVEKPVKVIETGLVRVRALDASAQGVACAGDYSVIFLNLDLEIVWRNDDVGKEAVTAKTPPREWFEADHTEKRVRDGRERRHIPIYQRIGHPQTVHDVLILDRVLTAGNDGAIRFLELDTGEEKLRRRGFSVNANDVHGYRDRGKKERPGPPDMTPFDPWRPGVYSLDLSPDGAYFVSCHGNGELRVSEAAFPYRIRTTFRDEYRSHLPRAQDVALYNGSWFAMQVCHYNSEESPAVQIFFWRPSSDSDSLISGTARGITPGYYSISTTRFIGGDARRVAIGCRDGRIELFDVPEQRFVHEFFALDLAGPIKKYDGWGDFVVTGSRPQAHLEQVDVLACSPDGKLLVSASSKLVDGDCMRLWDVETGTELCRFNLGGLAVWDAQFFSGGILTGGERGVVRLWQIPPGILQNNRIAAKPTDLSAAGP